MLDERLPPNFEGLIVYPFLDAGQSGADGGRSFSTLNGSTGLHLKEVVVRLRTAAGGDGDHVLRLTLNQELLSKGLATAVGGRLTAKRQEACFYQGVCNRVGHEGEDSYAAVSTCRGLRGTFHAGGLTFYIRPLDSSAPVAGSAACWPHLLLRDARLSRAGGGGTQAGQEPTAPLLPNMPTCGVRSGGGLDGTSDSQGAAGAQWLPFQDLHASEYSAKMHGSEGGPGSDQKTSRTKKIALAAVVDRAFLLQKNISEDDVVEYLLGVVNIVDRFYQPLGIRVTLAYYQMWRIRNEVTVLANVRETLQNFLAYAQGKMRDYSMTALITGQAFDDDLYGIAVPDSICSQRAAVVAHDGGSQTAQPHLLASNLAHLAGHVLGLQHDGRECVCGDDVGCLMESTRSASNEAPKKFSTCSAHRADTLTRAELGACLVEDGASSLAYQQFCGNGRIERGEQCDCGPPSRCHQVDPCCEASTCLLKPWATCRKGDCCEDCKPKSSASVCRPADGACDVPEYCDGINGECPANLIAQDGQPCANATAVCFRGQCRRRHGQCELHWGADAISATSQCYLSLNVLGDAFGHCGLEPDDGPDGGMNYRKCDVRDVLCGLLQCTGGSDQPRYRDQLKPGQVAVGAAARQTCKSLTVDSRASGAFAAAVLVEDGTSCGEGHICLSQACVPLSTLVTRSCPRGGADNRPCSGRGVCTNKVTCICESGYDGADCSIKLNTTAAASSMLKVSVTSTEQVPPKESIGTDELNAPPLDVKWLVVISLTIATAVVAATLATIFCRRRRRGALSKQKAAQHVAVSLNGRPSSFAGSVSLLPSRSETPDRSERHRSGSSRLPSQYSDDEESDEADDENDVASSTLAGGALKIPEELHRQPARGILKKTSRLREHDEPFSSDTCSCSDSDDDDSSTSWDGADREGPPIVHSLPRRPKSGSRGGGGSSSADDGEQVGQSAAPGADAAAAASAAAPASLTSPISVQVPPPVGRLLWQSSPLTHKALVAGSTLTEDSGNGTEASPGTSDDFGCGSTRSSAAATAAPPLSSFIELPAGKSRGRAYAVPVPPPCLGVSRGTADGGCEAEAGAGAERRQSNAVPAKPATPTQPSLSGFATIARDTASDRCGGSAAAAASYSDSSLSRQSKPPALAKAELVGLSPARALLNGQGEFVKQPSLTTFMPVPVKAVDNDSYGRTFAARPAIGPALTCGSTNGANGHVDGGTIAKRRPNVLDVKSNLDWADT